MLEFDTSKLSDDEILDKISQLNNQIMYAQSMPSFTSVRNQLMNLMDLLYDEQDRRFAIEQAKAEPSGIVYDSEKDDITKDEKSVVKKKKDFISNGPKIVRKQNPNHPGNKEEPQ